MNTKYITITLTLLLSMSALFVRQSYTAAEAAALDEVNPKSIDILGQNNKGVSLYISPKELIDDRDTATTIQNLFKKYHINLSDRDILREKKYDTYWQTTANIFEERIATQEPQQPDEIALDDVSELLADAKTIIKSLLLTDDEKLASLLDQNNYHQKSGLNRLFTYAQIKYHIKKKNLSHVHVPNKILAMQNYKTKEFITNKNAFELIDTILEIQFKSYPRGGYGDIQIGQNIHEIYDFAIFAEKIIPFHRPLNQEAFAELQELCKDCPFDVGYDNIFTDANGDAWIIDTEFKYDPPEACIGKLERYRHE